MDHLYEVDAARALPAAAYRPPAHEHDLQRIWRRSWVFVGTSDEVAAPGDYVSTDIGGQPVIVLRNQAGRLTALSNMCAHRGTLLVEGHGNTKRFRCPYHAWTYGDDGRLLGVPYADRDEVDRDDHHLPAYVADEWHGLVFVSLSREVAPLADRLRHLEPLAVERDMGSLHHWTERRDEAVWQANWKLVVSNAMESYHLFEVHETTLEPYSPTAGAYYIVGNADGTATGGSSSGDDYVLLSIPPNFVGVLVDDSLLWQAVQPIAADRSRIVTGAAYRHRPPEQATGLGKWVGKAAAAAGDALGPDFLPEDQAICERGQRGATGDFRPGSLVRMEHVIVDFHHFLNRQLHGVAAPPVARAPEVGVARAAPSGER